MVAAFALPGRVLGVQLSLEEVVTEHTMPVRKVWATVGTPRLLVIRLLRMRIHHQGAIDMATAELSGGKDPMMKKMATYAFSIGFDPALAGAGFGTKSCMASVATSAPDAAPCPPKPARLAAVSRKRADRAR